jgi:methylenetetrahydrofolate dehydrogenase (NADP+)/methenyltetrahydrofolate cyclohydrolase
VTARIIDGKAVAARLRNEYRERIAKMHAVHGLRPGLSVILVGQDPASQVYVRNKIRDCAEVGILSELIELPAAGA